MKTLCWTGLLLCFTARAFAQIGEAATTTEDQVDVAVTAYNNGIALVRDVRAIELPTGEVRLQFEDVAQQIRPETVSLRSISNPGSVSILEQNYEYDLISPQKLMEKYIGLTVRLQSFSDRDEFTLVDATLLSTNGGPVYEVDGEIFIGHPGTVVLPEIPENLIAKPSLIWILNNDRREQRIEATYLTGGISWKADYVITLAKDDASMDVSGWVTMNNQSGTTYENAKLKLVAGDVNVVTPAARMKLGRAAVAFEMAAASTMPQQEAFAEFHLYTIPRRTTIKQNQSKQLALLQANDVQTTKVYEYRGQVHYYSSPMPAMLEEHISVFIKFENEEENNMGMPLPAGVMRIYQEDSEGMLQFAGEDRIQHTPKDETVTLRMGKAFDVIGERVQTDYTRVNPRVHESTFEITLRNHKEEDIVVDIIEPMPGDWQILEESQAHVKRDARTAVYSVPVEADGESVVRYRVRVRY